MLLFIPGSPHLS